MWRSVMVGLLFVSGTSPVLAEDVSHTCSQLAIGLGQYEQVRQVCASVGTDNSVWLTQLKQLQCSQVLGDDVLTQIMNTANNDVANTIAAMGKTTYCEQQGTPFLRQLNQAQ